MRAGDGARADGNYPLSQSPAVYRFDSVLVRSPSRSVVDGLRTNNLGEPTYEGVKAEHEAYIAALRRAGVEVSILPALEQYPDSIFIEDPALVFTEGAIVLRPGAPTRMGEAARLEPTLRTRFATVISLPDDGFTDGGDVLVTPQRVLIGCSARTDPVGARALVEGLAKLGRRGEIVATPKGVLHFKTACSLMDDETILCTPQLAEAEFFRGFRRLIVPPGEEAAANALRMNDVVMVGAHHRRTVDMLDGAGFDVVALDTREIAKLDAGLSCMSLRWLGRRDGQH